MMRSRRNLERLIDDPAESQRRRCLMVGRLMLLLISLAMVALLGRVVQLQRHPDPRIALYAGRHDSRQTLYARRGALLDRRGRTLAVSHVGQRLFVDPKLIKEDLNFALDLARAIDDDPARIDQLIFMNQDRRYAVVRKLLAPDHAEAVRELNRRAIGIEPVPVRQYPYGALAGQVVGFVGEEHKGLDGVELMCNAELTGQAGSLHFVRDASRHPVSIGSDGMTLPEHGQDVRLSVDVVVQDFTETALHETCTKFNAKRGEAIVMDARSGQILAMANWPAYDPNDRGNIPPEFRRNRCVTDPYEPGSIFKPFIHAAATMAGVVKPLEKIDCTDSGFYVSPKGRRLRDSHGHGEITWEQVLIMSSNIGMAIVGQRLGITNMYKAVKAFGFGQRTGCGLAGESVGIVNPLSRWNHYSETSVPMGQEIAVTPLQVVRAFAAFANDGLMPAPTIFADHTDQPIYQRAIDGPTANATRLLLRRVVTEGTGRKAKSDRYRIWGKTGTAQVADRVNGGFLEDAYTASFVCGAPLQRPKVVVIVVVHQPQKSIGYYGGLVAAPAAKQIVENSLEYLGVPHDADEAEVGRDSRVARAD